MIPENTIEERKSENKKEKNSKNKKAKEFENKANLQEEKAVKRLESNKGNPVDSVLYERQRAINAKLDAIMTELGISE